MDLEVLAIKLIDLNKKVWACIYLSMYICMSVYMCECV